MNTNFHTESRMRENCTYGSMRDILRAEGESRSDALAEVRAFPTGRPALLYTLGVLLLLCPPI